MRLNFHWFPCHHSKRQNVGLIPCFLLFLRWWGQLSSIQTLLTYLHMPHPNTNTDTICFPFTFTSANQNKKLENSNKWKLSFLSTNYIDWHLFLRTRVQKCQFFLHGSECPNQKKCENCRNFNWTNVDDISQYCFTLSTLYITHWCTHGHFRTKSFCSFWAQKSVLASCSAVVVYSTNFCQELESHIRRKLRRHLSQAGRPSFILYFPTAQSCISFSQRKYIFFSASRMK